MNQSKKAPRITVKVSLSPTIYLFSDPKPPKLTPTVTSSTEKALSIWSIQVAFPSRLALCSKRYNITDVMTGTRAPQHHLQVHRTQPMMGTRGGNDGQYLMTVLSGVPKTFSWNIAPARPALIIDSPEVELTSRVYGFKDLEPDHSYQLRCAIKELRGGP
ncbi:MAG: hypothetical protein L6R37_007395 [Teloschistes peruensis]|nr:MAG: hypothetical protein L6R37_007395 [Teloschistes peruensis]